ncbi:MAG: hypothetical protein A2X05_01040 [Bacteroidetes bacterium GWE2_41_25]|nr:MAG: hypothetical protein A2X03_13910 [Bacteroidetes bacterium GWA2_40_15]OFX93765.1 MAG: hypothetical protein A2X05_01040 [Bacteroidetes bacterium GWE2_41_25]HAM11072.1 hypothetical protein [Bacteroidales bacterium]HBH85929.1 hypothetical protein [Bacteroidales bacterium]HCU20150.1 hypothetical protein [Bacteroidales bacterium]
MLSQQFSDFWLSVLLFVLFSTKVQAQVSGIFINEILSSNAASDYDAATSDYPDWIEIFNSNSSSVNLGGYFLTTDTENIKMWQIPGGTTVPANGFVSFWADDSDLTNHAGFALDKEGGFIGIYTSSGAVVDSFSYGFQLRDVSFGRSVSDPGKLVYFAKTTRGAANSQKYYTSISNSPRFSLRGGFYNGNQTVILTSPSPDAVIYFTTNGSEPDSASSVYSEPVTLTKTTALRARAVEEGALPGLTMTQTYLIDEEINLPVISIVTDSANFFDDSVGIYITGTNGKRGSCDATVRNLNQDWERPVNIELYEKDGSLGFNQEAGIKIYGGCSRTRFPQKSLALYARKSYGKGSFDYKLFPDKNIHKFESFILRSSADDQVRTFMRDALAQYICIGDMDLDIQAYRPAVVYFDGEYWGIHNIREKINEHYIVSNYNIDKKNINILQSNSSLVYGTQIKYIDLINYIKVNSLATTAAYNYFKTQIDIDQFIDYEILHIYLAERDWPGNNIKYWNSNTIEQKKWRWICFDLDQTFIRTTANTLADATATNGPNWPNPPWATLLLRSLLDNQEFKNRFIQRYAFYVSSTFSPGRLDSIVDVFKSVLEPEIPRHITKWGGLMDEDSQETWMPPTFSSLLQWQNNINVIKSFIRDRPSVALEHLRNKFGLKNLVTIKISPNIDSAGQVLLYDRKVPKPLFSGRLFPDLPVSLRATSNPGYRFLYWELTGNISRTDSAAEIQVTLTGNQEIKAVYEKTAGNEPVVIINEISYNSSPDFRTGDWVEIYNRRNDPVDLSGWKLKDSNPENEYVIPQGTIIQSNGYLVICEDINSFISKFHYLIHFRGNTGFGLKNEEEVIKLLNAHNKVIDSVHYTNKYPWPEIDDGKGYTLILKNTDLDNDLAENWMTSLKATPGSRNDNITGIMSEKWPDNSQDGIIKSYPNPCSSALTISYRIVSGGNVRIKVFDITGIEMATLVNDYRNPDIYSIKLNTNSFRNGIYFYSMDVDRKNVDLKKFIVIH